VLGAVWGFVILTLAGIVGYVFAPALVAFFVSGDADVVAEGARFIRVMSLVWGAIGVQLCIVSAFRASGNMLVAMVIAIVSQFMFQFPLAYVLSLYSRYYNETRTHLGLSKDTPLRRAVQRSGTIIAAPILSGLHHRYARI